MNCSHWKGEFLERRQSHIPSLAFPQLPWLLSHTRVLWDPRDFAQAMLPLLPLPPSHSSVDDANTASFEKPFLASPSKVTCLPVSFYFLCQHLVPLFPSPEQPPEIVRALNVSFFYSTVSSGKAGSHLFCTLFYSQNLVQCLI